MYNITVIAGQVLNNAQIHVSISETDDTKHTQVLASVKTTQGPLRGQDYALDLHNFCEQVVFGLSRALSVMQTDLDQPTIHAVGLTVGGGAVGSAEQPERSEDGC